MRNTPKDEGDRVILALALVSGLAYLMVETYLTGYRLGYTSGLYTKPYEEKGNTSEGR